MVEDKDQFLQNKIGDNMYLKPLKIGNVELKNNLILAQMAGITDLPFRIFCKEQ